MKKRIMILPALITTMMMLGACSNNVRTVEVSEARKDAEVIDEQDINESDNEIEELNDSVIEDVGDNDTIKIVLAEGIDYLHGTNGKEYDPTRALNKFEEAAGMGSVEADFLAGYVISEIMYGKNDSHTMDEAVAYYEECADESSYARARLGMIYYSGENGIVRDINKGKELCNSAVKEIIFDNINNSEDISIAEEEMTAAWLIINDYVPNEQLEKAFELAVDAENKGAINATSLLGYMYLEGWGTEVDYNKSRECCERAYEISNDRLACHTLGYIYEMGLGVDIDYAKAMSLYEEASSKGFANSYGQLAIMYEEGKGVTPDIKKATEYYEQAVELGSVNAMNNYGLTCVYNGDYEKAKSLFEKAVEHGNAKGYTNLAGLYMEGNGVEQDIDKAFEYTQKAADAGDADALANMGAMYYMGQGVEADMEKGMELFAEAARQGSMNGKAYCEQLGIEWN